MAGPHSTITVRADLKERLRLLKGRRSWDAFLEDVAERYPTRDLVRELELRLRDLKTGKRWVPWQQVKAERARRRK